MDKPEPGNYLQHVLSRANYWYIGQIPQSHLHSIVSVDEKTPYVVSSKELSIYYKKIDPPSLMVEGKTYVSNSTNATFIVEKIFKNPDSSDSGNLVAFGWYSHTDSDKLHPHYVFESAFGRWRPEG